MNVLSSVQADSERWQEVADPAERHPQDPESCPFGTRAPSLHITLHHRLQHHYAVHYISIIYIIIFHAGWLQPRSMPLVHLEHDLVLVHVLSFWRFPGERPVGTPANLLPRRRPLGAVVDLLRRRGQSGHSSSATASALTHHTAITIIFTSSSRKSSPQNVWIDVDQALRPCLLFSLKISFSDWFWGMSLLRKWGGGHSMVDCKEKSRECRSRCVSAPLDQEAEEVCIA